MNNGNPHNSALDVVIIGAGVIGLSIARELALAGREVIVLERNANIGEETSSRNSEVIHAGIYYPQDSLKAQLCTRGKDLLYSYCDEKSISYNRCGKLIVALTEDQKKTLHKLQSHAVKNGVYDTQILDAAEVRELEPSIQCSTGLFSPSTGIIDSHHLMLSLQGDLENAGGRVVTLSEFTQAHLKENKLHLTIKSDETLTSITAQCMINCAGLYGSSVANNIDGLDAKYIPKTRYVRGAYFTYQAKHPFQHLIYPVPEPGGLGIHLTLDLAGKARFGPDVEWIEQLEYTVDAHRGDQFFKSISSYWPNLKREALTPGYAGIRPKIVGPNDPPGDFIIQGPRIHGVNGLVNLFGIESPGLTASLAIAEHVMEIFSKEII